MQLYVTYGPWRLRTGNKRHLLFIMRTSLIIYTSILSGAKNSICKGNFYLISHVKSHLNNINLQNINVNNYEKDKSYLNTVSIKLVINFINKQR